jgi:hypothetical protein
LAETRGRLEELLRKRPSPEATFAAIEDTVEDIDRLIGVFNALPAPWPRSIPACAAPASCASISPTWLRSVAELYQPARRRRASPSRATP